MGYFLLLQKMGINNLKFRGRYIEFVQRNLFKYEENVHSNGMVEIYQGFLSSNASKIFESTKN